MAKRRRLPTQNAYPSNAKFRPTNRGIESRANSGFFNIVNGTSFLAVEPAEPSLYFGRQFKIDVPDDSTELIEKSFEFHKGFPVSGKVTDEVTGKGIPGVVIYYKNNAVESNDKTKAKKVAQTELKDEVDFVVDGITDANGKFNIVVPNQNGLVQLLGPVKGYRSIINFERVDKELLKRYQKEILAEELSFDKPLEFEFQLTRASRVTGIVSDKMGNPLANVNYSGKRISNFGYNQIIPQFRISSSRKGQTKTADSNSTGTIMKPANCLWLNNSMEIRGSRTSLAEDFPAGTRNESNSLIRRTNLVFTPRCHCQMKPMIRLRWKWCWMNWQPSKGSSWI